MMQRTLLCISLAMVVGCDDSESSPETLVDEPRILAVKADPPVIGATGSALLSSLVVDSTGERGDVIVQYRACSPWRPVRSPDVDCGPGVGLLLDGGVLDVAEVAQAFPPPSEDIDLLSDMTPDGERCDADTSDRS